jgi:hypothetical protein
MARKKKKELTFMEQIRQKELQDAKELHELWKQWDKERKAEVAKNKRLKVSASTKHIYDLSHPKKVNKWLNEEEKELDLNGPAVS